jgi:multidrug efflux pump
LAVIAPEGTSYESMEEHEEISNYVADSIRSLMKTGLMQVSRSIGTLVQPVNGGFQWIFLKDPKDRKSGLTQAQVYQKLIAASGQFRNVIVIPIQIPTIGGFSSSSLYST